MTVQFRPLERAHIPPLVELYHSGNPEYSRYFHPFPIDAQSLERILLDKKLDLYFVVLVDGWEAGFYMLRGFDEGYIRPGYGVWIAERYSGRGLARASLEHAVGACRSVGCTEIMLKVHPGNARARNLYERFGFVPTDIDSTNHNLVYALALPRSTPVQATDRAG